MPFLTAMVIVFLILTSRVFGSPLTESIPVFEGQTLFVETSVFIEDVNELNLQNMEFRLDYSLMHQWRVDKYICQQYQKILLNNSLNITEARTEALVLSSNFEEHLWRPDTWTKNAKRTESSPRLRYLSIKLLTNGDCLMGSKERRFSVISCQLEMVHYPFEAHFCGVEMRSYSYVAQHLQYQWSKEPLKLKAIASFAYDIQLRSAKMPENYTGIFRGQYNETYSYIEFGILFKRNIQHHLIAIFVPTGLIVLASFSTFWLKQTSDRLLVAVTSLLALVTQTNEARREVPPLSYVTALDIWIFACLWTNFLALLETIYNALHQLKLQSSENKVFPALYPLRPIAYPKSKRFGWSPKVNESNRKKRFSKTDMISRIIYPLIFFTFCIIYFIYHLLILDPFSGHSVLA